MPLVCNYYLTLRCNARCTFCDLWEHEDRTLADPESLLVNLRQLPSAGVRIVDFTGGEPLLHPELPTFLKAARDAGLITTVTTNAILYPQYAESLKGLINLFHISIDGAEAETHDHLRGVPCYDRVIASADLALSLGEKPDLLFTACRDNYRDVVPLAEYARDLSLVLIVNPAFEVSRNESALNRDQLEELSGLCRRPYVYLNGGVFQLMLEGGNDPERPRCRAVSSTIVISPKDELLLPCFHHAQAAVPIQGNLREALRSQQRLEALRRQGREDFCRNCTINCYLAPSLLYRFDRYFVSFLPWAAKYLYYRSKKTQVEKTAT